MFKLIFKGDVEPVYVPDSVGRDLRQKWLAQTLPERFEINSELSVIASSIKAIQANAHPEIDKEKIKAENERHGREIHQEYTYNRKKRLELTPLERAQDINLANLVFWSVSGKKEMPEELKITIRERQKVFFEQNPHLTQANSIVYKDELDRLYPVVTQKPEEFEIKLRDAAMRLAERIVAEDKLHSHENHDRQNRQDIL